MSLIEQARADFEKGMTNAARAHEKGAASEVINEGLLYARDQLNIMIEEMQVQGLLDPDPGIPPLAKLEARLEAMESLVSGRPTKKGKSDE